MLTETIGETTYTYDNVGNILTANGHTYTYGDSTWRDLLTAVNGVTISYDEIGNPLTWYNGSNWILTWENGRQLKEIKHIGGGRKTTFTYDADGLRLSKTFEGITRDYTYAGGKLMREVITRPTDSGTTTEVWDFFYDEAGRPFAVKVDGVMYYYITNLQGDVMQIVDSNGTTVATYDYDPYGNIAWINGNLAYTNPIRYRGYYFDTETGFYYLQSRYYDPETGRFINADAFASTGQGILGNNMFAYCLGNPVDKIDISGGVAENVVYPVCLGGNGPKKKYLLSQDEEYMLEAGAEFGVDPAMIATAIAVEQNYNVNIFDLADIPFGLLGVNTSVGIGQVRITTAESMEELGYIEKSAGHWDRVWRLSDSKTNIRYVAAYLSYLRDKWVPEDPDFEQCPDIWWTVYNTGNINAHSDPKHGLLGAEAKIYYSYYEKLFGQ